MSGQTGLDTKEEEINKKLDEIMKNVNEIKASQLKVNDIVKKNFENFKQEIIHELTVSIDLHKNTPLYKTLPPKILHGNTLMRQYLNCCNVSTTLTSNLAIILPFACRLQM